MTPHEQIQSNILELQQALIAAHPTMPTLLRTIHASLKANPDVVTLLTPEEIGIVVTGLKRQTNIEIISKATPASKKAKMATISTDDLGF